METGESKGNRAWKTRGEKRLWGRPGSEEACETHLALRAFLLVTSESVVLVKFESRGASERPSALA